MAKKRSRGSGVVGEMRNLLRSIRKLKDRLTGNNLRRMHRVESEVMTVAGMKAPMMSSARRAASAARKATRDRATARSRKKA